jgi:hypothetical protein
VARIVFAIREYDGTIGDLQNSRPKQTKVYLVALSSAAVMNGAGDLWLFRVNGPPCNRSIR